MDGAAPGWIFGASQSGEKRSSDPDWHPRESLASPWLFQDEVVALCTFWSLVCLGTPLPGLVSPCPSCTSIVSLICLFSRPTRQKGATSRVELRVPRSGPGPACH